MMNKVVAAMVGIAIVTVGGGLFYQSILPSQDKTEFSEYAKPWRKSVAFEKYIDDELVTVFRDVFVDESAWWVDNFGDGTIVVHPSLIDKL